MVRNIRKPRVRRNRSPEKKLPPELRPPEFMARYSGQGLENLGEDAFSWVGAHWEMSDETFADLERAAFGSQAALQEILIPIIRSHAFSEKNSDKARLNMAMRALLGDDFNEAKKTRRGPSEELSDEFALRVVAREYFRDWVSHRHKRSLTALCELAAAETDKRFDQLDKPRQDTIIRRLRAKFTGGYKDRLLVAFSQKNDWRGGPYRLLVDQVLANLTELRIVERIPRRS